MAIPISTTPPDRPCEVLDTVAAVGVATAGVLRGAPRLDAALEDCKAGLRQFAQALDADAVVSCHFETHFDSRTINVAGFGTAVRWK
jgi:hypothetical protein